LRFFVTFPVANNLHGMKSLTAALLVGLSAVCCTAQTSVQRMITDPNSGFFVFWGMSTTSDTGLILAGISDFPNAALVKTDRNLVPQWYKAYPGVWEFDHAIETPDGGYLALGRTLNGRAILMKCDSAGGVQWTSHRITGSVYGGGHLYVMPSGEYSVVIQAGGGISLARVDTAGNVLWEKNYMVTADAQNFRFAQPTPEHGWIVCATYYSAGGTCLMKLDSLGNIIWQKAFSPNTHGFAVHVDESGYFFSSHNSASHIVFRTDTSGNLLWAREWPMLYSNNVSEYAYSVVQNGEELICYGDRYVGMTSYPVMIGFDTAGNTLWNRFYSPNPSTNVMTGNSAIMTQDDKIVFINGESSGSSYWLVKMDSTGDPGCNAFNAGLTITPFSVVMGTSTLTPAINTNPWAIIAITDSIGGVTSVPLCDPLVVSNGQLESFVNVFPNPAIDIIVIERIESGTAVFELADVSGRIVVCKTIVPGEQRIVVDISEISNGLYVWRLSSDRERNTGKLIIE
jgi:hypothetical protein